MKSIEMWIDSLTINQKTGPGINNISPDIKKMVAMSKIQNGSVALSIVGSTGSITTIEYEPGVVQDLKDAINRIAPEGIPYQHELAWHDGNGHSHVQAAIMGPSIVVPVRNGSLRLGTWQQIVVINHDNHARQRTVEVTIIGNSNSR